MHQPVILDQSAVERLLPGIDIYDALEQMFLSLAKGGATQPPQSLSLFPNNGGDFITYLGVLADQKVFGAKLSPYITTPDGALVTAWTMLLSIETGAPLLLCDAKTLTTERTAATTAIAVNRLAQADASVLTIIGTGPLGMAHLRYAQSLRPWREVRLSSPRAERKKGLPTALDNGCPITAIDDANDAARGADVVMLCTSSGTPVLDVACVGQHGLITSISTNSTNAHEIAPEALAGLDVYCDYAATTPGSAGEMKLATAAGIWSREQLRGDLPGLVAGTAALPSRQRPAFFRSIGLGLEDIAAAAALLAAPRR